MDAGRRHYQRNVAGAAGVMRPKYTPPVGGGTGRGAGGARGEQPEGRGARGENSPRGGGARGALHARTPEGI